MSPSRAAHRLPALAARLGLAMIVALIGRAGTATAEEVWRKVADKDGILVEARGIPGARVREVRATAEIAASVAACYAVVHAFDDYPRTLPYVKAARLLRSDGDSLLWTYARVEAPLVSARDYTLRVTTSRGEDGTIRMAWVPANEAGPPPERGVVRVEINQGSWTFSPIDGRRTRAVYQLLTDPGGNVTTWLADQANKTAVPDVIRAVRKAAIAKQ